MKAGVPEKATAWGLNQVCGSGLRAVAIGMQQIVNGDAKVIVAGGQESMSLSAHAANMRAGTKMGDVKFVDTMIKDGLWDAFHGYHMGTTAENVATQFQSPGRSRTSSPSPPRTRRRRREMPGASRTRSRR
jgi:acetyl-CoA C-acetyltransferase